MILKCCFDFLVIGKCKCLFLLRWFFDVGVLNGRGVELNLNGKWMMNSFECIVNVLWLYGECLMNG